MTIGAPHSLYIGAWVGTTSDNPPFTLTGGAAVGERAWLFWCSECGDSTPTVPTFTVSDTKGNTWSTFQATRRNGVTLTTAMIYGATTVVTSALAASDVVTVNVSGTFGCTRAAVCIAAATGVDTLDQQAISDPGSTSSLSIGPTSATDTSQEIVWAWWGSGTRVFTPGSGYSEFAEIASTAGSSDRQLSLEYKITSTTGAQTATGSFNTATTVVGALATYRATVGAPPPESDRYYYDGVDWKAATSTLL